MGRLTTLTTLKKRILSALVLGALTIWVIYAGGYPFRVFIALGGGLALYEFYGMEKKGRRFLPMMVVWTLYTLVCAAAFIHLREAFSDGLYLVLAVMLTVWACDTGAYVTGKNIGGPKLAPVLSPKKTWSGLIGGVVCSGLVLTGLEMWHDSFSLPFYAIFLLGCVLGAVGQAGDLLISSIKRRVGVKDTGALIPGHGGLLDRIDSLLLVVPVFVVLYNLLQG